MSNAVESTVPVPPKPPSFPLLTVAVSLGLLFLFLAAMWGVERLENPLTQPKPEGTNRESSPDAAAKLDEVTVRNRNALDGVGAKMSLRQAHGELLKNLKGPNDKLPYPVPQPPPAASGPMK
jgi:hypothetical protein